MKRLDKFTLKLLDQIIGEDELRELAQIAQTPEGKESLLQLMELESHLHASRRSSTADRVLGQIQQDRRERVEAGVMGAVVVDEVRSPVVKGSWPRPLRFVGVTAMAACLLIMVFFSANQSNDQNGAIAHLNSHGSIVRILDANGNVRSSQSMGKRFALRANETVETSQPVDTAEIVYTDGSKIELLGETRIRLIETPDGSKEIAILSGVVQADVAPQPKGHPLRIVTQAASLEVLGTTLGVEVRDASTQLGVATGRVSMTRKADGQRVEVEAGRFATATESISEPFQSYAFPELPNEWSEDFDGGLPTGWRSGEFVEFQDRAAVRAIRSKRTSERRYVITSHNAWQEGKHGLCRIDNHSVLHLRIRQSEFARITIMIGTRSYPPATGRTGGNLFYTKQSWNNDLPADTWRTISIPLNDLGWRVRQGYKTRGPAALGDLAAYLIHVTTMEQDAGLSIDRVWITKESEAVVEEVTSP